MGYANMFDRRSTKQNGSKGHASPMPYADLLKTVTLESRALMRQRGIAICTESCWMVEGSRNITQVYKAASQPLSRTPHDLSKLQWLCWFWWWWRQFRWPGRTKDTKVETDGSSSQSEVKAAAKPQFPASCAQMCTVLVRLYTQIKLSHRIKIINITTSGKTWSCFLVFLQIWVSSDSSIFGVVGGLGHKTTCAVPDKFTAQNLWAQNRIKSDDVLKTWAKWSWDLSAPRRCWLGGCRFRWPEHRIIQGER